jgi:O-antigen/teichoic acid export membrane protein
MKLASVVRLSQGLAVQLVCYAGLFLSLAVAARALSPSEFGTYASAVAIASFAGSVITFGLDRIVLRVLLLREGSQTGERHAHPPIDAAVFVPAAIVNAALLLAAGALTAAGWLSGSSLFIAVMAVLVASRLVLSGWFKFVVNNHANVIATFGLQSLAVALILSIVMVIAPDSPLVARSDGWMVATLLAETVQLAILAVLAKRQGFKINWRDALHLRAAMPHARAGLLISLLCLFAQTGLLGITFSRVLMTTVDQGIFTVAYRVSQLIIFPLIGASQLIIPLSSRTHAQAEAAGARREVRDLLRSTNAFLVGSTLGFAILGLYLLDIVMHISDGRAYACVLILSAGNLVMGMFGVGDQIMIAVGRHRTAFWISLWCGGVLFPVLAVLALMAGYGIMGLAAATAISIALRSVVAYGYARRVVNMPIAVFDRA